MDTEQVTPAPEDIKYYSIYHEKAFKPRCGKVMDWNGVVIFVSADGVEVLQLESKKCARETTYEEYADAMDVSGGIAARSLGNIRKGISSGIASIGQSMVNTANRIRR